MASEKQINYALDLLRKAGYSTNYMDSSFKSLGAKMTERTGTVRAWLQRMESAQISALIDRLKDEPTA